MEERICPRCGEGRVGAFVVRGTAEHLWVCDSCEATWRGDDLESTEFEHLSSVVLEGEGPSAWEDLEPVEGPDAEV